MAGGNRPASVFAPCVDWPNGYGFADTTDVYRLG